MTKEDLEIVSNLINKVRNGTQVKIYDNDGTLFCFALEDVIHIREDKNKHTISYIYIKNKLDNYASLCLDDGDHTNCIKIKVFGSANKWKKLLKFEDVNVLNHE